MVTAALVAECGAPPRPLPSAKEVGKGVLQERLAKVIPFALYLEGAEEFRSLFSFSLSACSLFSFSLSCRSWEVVGVASGFQHWIRRSWKELPKQGRGGSCLPGDRGRAAAGRSQVWRPQAPPGCLIYRPSGSDAWVAGTPNLLVLFLKWPLSTLTFENYAIRNISPQDCTYLNNISWQ